MCNNESVTSTLLALYSALVLWSSSSSSLFFSCVLLLLKHVSVNKEAHEDCICYSTAKSMLHIAGRERKRGRKWTICCLGLFFLLEFLGNRRGIHILNSLLPMPRAMSIRLDLTANRIQRTLDISHAHLFKYHTVSSFSSLSLLPVQIQLFFENNTETKKSLFCDMVNRHDIFSFQHTVSISFSSP